MSRKGFFSFFVELITETDADSKYEESRRRNHDKQMSVQNLFMGLLTLISFSVRMSVLGKRQ